MLRLRKILLFDLLYFIILLIVLVISLIRISLPSKSNYNQGSIKESFTITKITIDGTNFDVETNNQVVSSKYILEFEELSNEENIEE